MNAEKELRVGIVGYGMMGRAHAYAFHTAPLIRPSSVCFRPVVMSGRNRDAAERAASRSGVGEVVGDWRELVERRDLDVVAICTPPGTHAEIAEAAAASGKDVFCEKPLASSYADALRARDAVVTAGVRHAVGFNYRRQPALALMADMVARGELGEVRLWRATWLSDEFVDPTMSFDWRFDAALGGSTFGDLGSHLLDLATWMLGPIAEVSATSTTFVDDREEHGSPRHVEVDEASSALVRFASGVHGTLEVTRVAPRHPCDFTFEINGTKGTVLFSYPQLNDLWFGTTDDDPRYYGLRRIRVEHPTQPETEGWWPIGQGVGYDASLVNQVAHLAGSWLERAWSPDFTVGADVVAVCTAMERSVLERRRLGVEEITSRRALVSRLGSVSLRLYQVTFDAYDPSLLGRFWAAALNQRVLEADDEVVVVGADESSYPGLCFVRVPHTKTIKNRLHLDLDPDDRDTEVERLLALGATRVSVGEGPEVTWVVLADPEGNEFCVLRPHRSLVE